MAVLYFDEFSSCLAFDDREFNADIPYECSLLKSIIYKKTM